MIARATALTAPAKPIEMLTNELPIGLTKFGIA
jgi:hypothetical protein